MLEVQVQLYSRKGQNFGVKMDDQERNPRDKSSQFIGIAGIGSGWDLLPVLRWPVVVGLGDPAGEPQQHQYLIFSIKLFPPPPDVVLWRSRP